jgi:glycosyltransferase involved in cell wall biosynthesis
MLEGARIAVVVPAHNEQRHISTVVERMPAFVDWVVVVDDASTDQTSEAAVQSADPRVRVVRHAHNRGVGAAIATGYREARRRGADVVAVMAGDNQMHPDDLSSVLLPVAQGNADYCKGDRLHHRAARAMPAVRRIGTWLFGYLTRWALALPGLSDSQCGFTAIGAHALDQLDLDRLWPGFGYPNDLLGQLSARGLSITQVPVRPVYGDERSELRVHHALIIVWLIARAGWRSRRKPTR